MFTIIFCAFLCSVVVFYVKSRKIERYEWKIRFNFVRVIIYLLLCNILGGIVGLGAAGKIGEMANFNNAEVKKIAEHSAIELKGKECSYYGYKLLDMNERAFYRFVLDGDLRTFDFYGDKYERLFPGELPKIEFYEVVKFKGLMKYFALKSMRKQYLIKVYLPEDIEQCIKE